MNSESLSKNRVFIIAELSANHSRNLSIALQSVESAARAGADAIKLQTFKPDSLTMDLDYPMFRTNPDGIWAGIKLYDLYMETMLPWEWHQPIFDKANEIGIDCFSSPFDIEAVDFLTKFDPPAYKIASFEITDIPLIKHAAKQGKPMIISTGIATLDDIELAVNTCRSAGNNDITLLKCTSSYPTPPSNANLNGIKTLKEKFNVAVGLSDHTLGTEAPMIAVALGATVIEKHFMLDKNIQSADSSFSLDEIQFKEMVDKVRLTEKLLGSPDFKIDKKLSSSRTKMRTLFISRDIPMNTSLTNENIKSIRSHLGLHTKYYDEVLGKRINRSKKKGEPLNYEDIDF